jgi:hypothetical protein
VAVALAVGTWCTSARSAQAAGWGSAPAERPQWDRPSLGLSLVTRDWQGGRPLIGPLVTSDFVRPSRSSQMLVGRLRLSTETVASFIQLGVGYWRLDAELIPRHGWEQDKAGQLGAGIEWMILSGATSATIGVESESTVLLRGRVPSTVLRGSALATGMLVARVTF